MTNKLLSSYNYPPAPSPSGHAALLLGCQNLTQAGKLEQAGKIPTSWNSGRSWEAGIPRPWVLRTLGRTPAGGLQAGKILNKNLFIFNKTYFNSIIFNIFYFN